MNCQNNIIRITLDQETTVWSGPKQSNKKDAFLDKLFKPDNGKFKVKTDSTSEPETISKETHYKQTDCSSCPETKSLDDLIPELDNDFYGKGRNAELPKFLDMDDSRFRTLEGLLGSDEEYKINIKTPSKKRENKALSKLDYNKIVDELLKYDEPTLQPADTPC
jgi:hypothetical protein